MSTKLHAQMALYGTIDWVVRHANNPETVQMVERLLPGTTGVGQQGWFDEVQRFLSTDELKPFDVGDPRRPVEVAFPDYGDALNELAGQGVIQEDASPAVLSRAL